MKTPFDHPSGDRGARTPLATLPGPASRRHRWLMQSLILLTLAVLAAMFALPAQAGGPPGDPRGGEARGVVSGQILVQPRAGLSEQEFEKILQRAGGRSVGKLRNLDVHVVKVAPQAEEAVARALARNPNIKFAEPDFLIAPEEFVPNDPHYSKGWHLTKLNLPTAWTQARGEGIVVAILDTGVDPYHLDLQDNLVPGRNVASNSSDTSDVNGHGTQVAGTVAALTDNANGIASVAFGARIMPVRVTDRSDGVASASAIANGITWAADNGARVANASYAAGGSSTVKSAGQYMRNKGGIVMVSAGNGGTDPGWPDTPALVIVAATNSSDGRPSWSNYGDFVDLSAPGVSVYTTKRGGSYGSVSGTSFSSPIAASVAALVMSANPALSPDDVESIIKTTAADLGATGWDPYYGAGRVDGAAAVDLALRVAPSDTTPPTVAIMNPQSGAQVSGVVAVDVAASDEFGVSKVELYAGKTLVGTETTSPYAFSVDSTQFADGELVLVADAYDASGNKGSTQSKVSVANASDDGEVEEQVLPLRVTVTGPADGATVSGVVRMSALGEDGVGVPEVRIFLNGALQCSGSPSASCNWNSRRAKSGNYTISAEARDGAGNTATDAVTVTVK